MTQQDLHPVIPIGFGPELAARHTCPRCGHNNLILWERERLQWYPTEQHCEHYQGAYETGSFATVQLHYR